MSFPARFGTYEVFRIILPGFYFVGLLCIVAYLFFPTRHLFIQFSKHQVFLPAVAGAGILVGLVLYAYDHPKRIRAYRKLEMPSVYLKKKLCDNCKSSCENKIEDNGEAVDTYFYVLLELLTSTAQQRIFYIGSVYHVLADVRMLSGVFGVLLFPVSFVGVLIGELSITDAAFGLSLSVFLVILWLYLHPEFFCRKNESKGDKYLRYIMKMQKRFIDLKIERIKKELCRKGKQKPKQVQTKKMSQKTQL